MDSPRPPARPRTSRQRYAQFVDDYRRRRLDEAAEAAAHPKLVAAADTEQDTRSAASARLPGKRKQYVRAYLRWLKPHRVGVAILFTLALLAAGLQMLEPLFMRFIIDKVLLAPGLAAVTRMSRLNIAGFTFLALIIVSNLIGALKDYRQRVLNTKVMLSLRHSLFERLLHLPLPKLWDMKTGGILSRLTGDVDTTTGLMQMAIVSPSVSLIRLIIAVGILMSLNWRLALTAMAILPGVMAISFVSARRIRPI
jgi:ATP-binding cassette subfamily B protein